jgi:peptidoglycan/xylan/chitin deacetylase (PgdA/CDA1 family)
MYHFFGPAPPTGDPERMFVEVEALMRHVTALYRDGWRPLDLDGYLAALDGGVTPRRSFLVTIDDAHASVPLLAAPRLAAAGVPSVLFVPTELVGRTVTWEPAYAGERLADAEALRSVAATGMELGVHGADHARMLGMGAEELERQVARARDALAEITGQPPRAFAYPYGTHDGAAREAVAAAGFDVAFAVAREHGRFAVDRVGVSGADTPRRVRGKVSLGYRAASRAAGRLHRPRHAVRDSVHALRRRLGATSVATPAR